MAATRKSPLKALMNREIPAPFLLNIESSPGCAFFIQGRMTEGSRCIDAIPMRLPCGRCAARSSLKGWLISRASDPVVSGGSCVEELIRSLPFSNRRLVMVFRYFCAAILVMALLPGILWNIFASIIILLPWLPQVERSASPEKLLINPPLVVKKELG